MELNFRTFTADEIECKAVVVGNVIEVSLYAKAHICTRILNKTVGPMGWEKVYTNGNRNCIVRIWDTDKQMMISKEDCGGPMTDVDGAKGQASNGFKRVCALGWGLGIELYSQPNIKFPTNDSNTVLDGKNGMIVTENYSVKEIKYNDEKEIVKVVIVDSNGRVVYDGPDEGGKSRVDYPEEEDEVLIIPEDDYNEEEEVENDEYDDQEDATSVAEKPVIVESVETKPEYNVETEDKDYSNAEAFEDDLPDNTDGYEDSAVEECEPQPMPFSEKKMTYREEIEAEIARTHVKRSDVLKSMGITSFDELNTVYEEVVIETIKKLKALKTYSK